MNATVVRLMLAPVVLWATVAAYVSVLFVLDEVFYLLDEEGTLVITNLVCGAFLIGAWLLVWRGEIHWTRKRVWLTTLSAPASVILVMVGCAVFLLMSDSVSINDMEIWLILGAIWSAAVWGCS